MLSNKSSKESHKSMYDEKKRHVIKKEKMIPVKNITVTEAPPEKERIYDERAPVYIAPSTVPLRRMVYIYTFFGPSGVCILVLALLSITLSFRSFYFSPPVVIYSQIIQILFGALQKSMQQYMSFCTYFPFGFCYSRYK